uniref:rhomboid protease n=1 Tax=Entomoneis paludosa TaxID=265537 RepID=A0A7S2YTY3_9STRA
MMNFMRSKRGSPASTVPMVQSDDDSPSRTSQDLTIDVDGEDGSFSRCSTPHQGVEAVANETDVMLTSSVVGNEEEHVPDDEDHCSTKTPPNAFMLGASPGNTPSTVNTSSVNELTGEFDQDGNYIVYCDDEVPPHLDIQNYMVDDDAADQKRGSPGPRIAPTPILFTSDDRVENEPDPNWLTPEEIKYAIEKAVRDEIRLERRKRKKEQKKKGLLDQQQQQQRQQQQQETSNDSQQSDHGRSSLTVHKTTKPHAIHELCVVLQNYPEQGLSMSRVYELLPKIQDFHVARFSRRRKFRSQPWGVLGLFMYIADMRLDLEWVEDRAWRRQEGQPKATWLSWWDFAQLHAHNDIRRTYFVYIMHVIYIILMLVAFHLNDWKVEPMNVNPMLGPSAEVLMDMGALNADAVFQDHEWYRLVTPMFLHAGIIHLVINMLALQFVGGPVERVLGTMVTTMIFVVSAVGGNIASVLLGIPGTVSVGASGGLFGLLGLCLASIATNWDLITLKNHCDKSDKGFPYRLVLFVLAVEMMINLLVGLTPFIDNFCHLGGLLYGILLGIPLLAMDRVKLFGWRRLGHFTAKNYHISLVMLSRMCCFVAGVGLLAWSTWALVTHDGGDEGVSYCPSCKYITCATFPFWKGADPWWHCDSCHTSTGTYVRYTGTTILTMTCPDNGRDVVDPVVVDLGDPNITPTEISDSLAGYCRNLCPN